MSWFKSSSTINMVAFLPVAKELFAKLEMAIEMIQKAEGSVKDPSSQEIFSKILFENSNNWNVVINQSDILDDDTKMHACRFVVGIACNLLRK
jgi:hypothetical protein